MLCCSLLYFLFICQAEMDLSRKSEHIALFEHTGGRSCLKEEAARTTWAFCLHLGLVALHQSKRWLKIWMPSSTPLFMACHFHSTLYLCNCCCSWICQEPRCVSSLRYVSNWRFKNLQSVIPESGEGKTESHSLTQKHAMISQQEMRSSLQHASDGLCGVFRDHCILYEDRPPLARDEKQDMAFWWLPTLLLSDGIWKVKQQEVLLGVAVGWG